MKKNISASLLLSEPAEGSRLRRGAKKFGQWSVTKGVNRMSKVVSINRDKFLGAYCSAQEKQRIPDNTFFYAGVFLTTVVPVIIYCASDGPVSPMLFALVALTGTIGGLVKYNQRPYRKVSFVSNEAIPKARAPQIIKRRLGVPTY
jgi:hypothetical protein